MISTIHTGQQMPDQTTNGSTVQMVEVIKHIVRLLTIFQIGVGPELNHYSIVLYGLRGLFDAVEMEDHLYYCKSTNRPITMVLSSFMKHFSTFSS